MVRSMTAYGRAFSMRGMVVEVHCVNKKHLECSVSLPRGWLFLDLDIRKCIAEKIARGYVTVRVSERQKPQEESWGQKIGRMAAWHKEAQKACHMLGVSTDSLSFPFLYEQCFSLVEELSSAEEETIAKEVHELLEKALTQCVGMKKEEGKALGESLEASLLVIEQQLHIIEKHLPHLVEVYRAKLYEKWSSYKEVTTEDKERLLREAFLFGEKVDIAEEVTRMYSHIAQMRGMLNQSGVVGKSIEFLLQEMVRETSTLASKSEAIELTYAAWTMKGEIEKMKEQVLNIE